MEVKLTDGRTLRSHVLNARGSAARPMTDDELDAKFRAQASLVLPAAKVEELLRLCRRVASLQDVGKEIASVFNA
ncbi:MAG: MmgE/PrpD C-terminal domain [Pseudomonadota bacterium]